MSNTLEHSAIIRIEQLSKQFNEKQALRHINLSIQKGEIFGFLGPSGAGKTTTINILTGQMMPSSGQAVLMGQSIHTLNAELFRRIGVLTDSSGIYERLSVYDNMKFFADLYRLPSTAIEEVLKKIKLWDDRKTLASKLSKGMRQRLLLGRALIHKPEVLFLDEPTSALDPATSKDIHEFLLSLNAEGTTIFLTTHRMEEAEKLCHRVAFLSGGEIVEVGNPDELRLKYAKELIEIQLADQTNKIYLPNQPDSAERIAKWIREGRLVSIHSVEPNLEDIFLTLTGRSLA